jgi:hypothetical protein
MMRRERTRGMKRVLATVLGVLIAREKRRGRRGR